VCEPLRPDQAPEEVRRRLSIAAGRGRRAPASDSTTGATRSSQTCSRARYPSGDQLRTARGRRVLDLARRATPLSAGRIEYSLIECHELNRLIQVMLQVQAARQLDGLGSLQAGAEPGFFLRQRKFSTSIRSDPVAVILVYASQ
jgi:hypothetical protein